MERKKSQRLHGHIGHCPQRGSWYPESHLQRDRVFVNSGPRRRVTQIRNSGWETPLETFPRDKAHCVRGDAWTKLLLASRSPARAPTCWLRGADTPTPPRRSRHTELPFPCRQQPSPARPRGTAGEGAAPGPSRRPREARPGPDPAARTAARRGGGAEASLRCPQRGKPQVSAPSWGFLVAAFLYRGARGEAAPATRPKLSVPAYLGGGGPAGPFPSARPAVQRPRTPRHHYPLPPAALLPSLSPPCPAAAAARRSSLTPPSSRPAAVLPPARPPALPAGSHAARCLAPRRVSGPPARAPSLARTQREGAAGAALSLSA